jgi:uncharacterized protein
MAETQITDNTALHHFELKQDGETAFILYSRSKNSLRLLHTDVPEALQGKGIGSKLVRGVVEFAENNHLSVIPACPFVAEYLKRHPEHLSVVDPEYKWMVANSE